MIFECKNHVTWDTWMYFRDNKYYLYYLITDRSGGEGFGVAVSEDGIHYEDRGTCITASDKMVIYLGTGAVWESPDFKKDKTFICNYSEWRRDESAGKHYQNIFFATSKDLIHWEKTGEDGVFPVDERYYVRCDEDGGRWDCIYPNRTAEGYEGFFTATPKEYIGCGYAVSEDGLRWTAKKPPKFSLDGHDDIRQGVEAGAVCVYGGKYYMLMGTYLYRYGMSVMVSDSPDGIYRPQKKNFSLLSNRSFMHAYFMRIADVNGKKYVNHHVLLRETNEFGRNTTLAAPLKEIDFDEEGILRLRWAALNEGLKGEEISDFDFENGFVAEYESAKADEISFKTDKETVTLRFGFDDCSLKIFENGVLAEDICKDVCAAGRRVRILYRNTLMEVYADDYFVTCYTFKDGVRTIENQNGQKIWRINL